MREAEPLKRPAKTKAAPKTEQLSPLQMYVIQKASKEVPRGAGSTEN